MRVRAIPAALAERLRSGPGCLVDLGCGNGGFLEAVRASSPTWRLIGVDVSEAACRATLATVPGVTVVCATIGETVSESLAPGCADVVVSRQVISGMADRSALMTEAARLLRPGGLAWITSFARGRRAVYFYRHDGRFVLDRTYINEYGDISEMVAEAEDAGLQVIDRSSERLRFHVVDMLLRGRRQRPLQRGPVLRVPGYAAIGIVARA